MATFFSTYDSWKLATPWDDPATRPTLEQTDVTAAHIKAVVPPQLSCAFTCAPWSRRTLTASIFPVRAAIMSAVFPSIVRGASTAAPALSSFSIMAAFPLMVARSSGLTMTI